MSALLDSALQYAARGWRVFPLTRSKVPFKGSHGHLDASSDRDTVEALWRGREHANIGLALDRLVVLDADGAGGMATLKAMSEAVGGLPPTLAARSPRGGLHLYYQVPDGLSLRGRNAPRTAKGGDGLDLKGCNGYVLLPPSQTAAGLYQWVTARPIAELTPAMVEWCVAYAGQTAASDPVISGARPAYLGGSAAGPSLAARTRAALAAPWTAHEEARLRAALHHLAAEGYDEWREQGMALHHLEWTRGDGTDAGFDLWVEQSERFPEKFSHAACEAKWATFGRGNGARRTIASIFHAAREAGWDGTVDAGSAPPVTGANGVHALAVLPAAITAPPPIVFPDTNKVGKPTATCRNTRIAIVGMGVNCCYNLFHNKMLVGGHPMDQWAGEISDSALQVLRVAIEREFQFDPGTINVHDAAVQECLQHPFDPVADYLDGLRWDGRARLGTWLHQYLGAEPSELNSETGRLMLIAAVRRVKQPGAKFDQIMVLEGHEGKNKSTAIEILAGADNFSDQTILGAGDREVQELLQGVWLYEIADLTGISRAESERVKAFASRKVDRARPAYGRTRVDRPRRCVFFASTNDSTYLKSETGNRRFWPVMTGHILVDDLARDRDQLWAEAVAQEARGVPTGLAERLWGAATAVQDTRREHDPWDDIILGYFPKESYPSPDGLGREYRVSGRDLMDLCLRLPTEKQTAVTAKRLAFSMRRCGWDGPKVMQREGERTSYRGYTKRLR